MKLVFRGWRREVFEHAHDVIPLTMENGRYKVGKAGEPLIWKDASRAEGKITGLGLSGSFHVGITFDRCELSEWIRTLIKEEPEAAVTLLAEMQGQALVALARATEERLTAAFHSHSLRNSTDGTVS